MSNVSRLRIAIYSIFFFASLILLCSCLTLDTPIAEQVSNGATQTESILPQQVKKLEEIDIPTEQVVNETAQILNVIPKYSFSVIIDYDQHTAEINEVIEYQNRTGERLTLLQISIPPDHYPDSFSLSNYSSEPDSELIAPIGNHDPWVVDLSRPLEAGEIIRMAFNYVIHLPATAGSFGYSEQQANFQNWYPYIQPLDLHKGWIDNDYSPIGEYIVSEKANFFVNIRANQDLVIAGAGKEYVNPDGSITFTHVNTRDFTFSISPKFRKYSTDLGNVVVNAYVFSDSEDSAKELIRNSSAALVYFGSLYDMDYPHATLNIVEADFPDGMEADGIYFLSRDYLNSFDGTHRNYLTILSAHETAHQWFYGIVGNNQATEPWLDEALCTLSEILYYQEFYSSDAEWWWDYRVNSYKPDGNVDGSVYQYDSLRSYLNEVYLQGARFLHELRTLVGDEAFITALRNYVYENSNRIADEEDFFRQFALFNIDDLKDLYFFQ